MNENMEVPDPVVVKLVEEGIKKFYVVWGNGSTATLTTILVNGNSRWDGSYLQKITWYNIERGGRTYSCQNVGAAGLRKHNSDRVFTNYWLAYGDWLRRGKK